MALIWSMMLESAEILALVAGVSGIVLSLMLMLNPALTRKLNQKFDRWFHFDEKLAVLDTDFNTDRFIFRHHLVAGTVMIIGSLFCLIFLFVRLDLGELGEVFSQGGQLPPLSEILLNSAVILGKVAAVAGIVLGSLLIFASGKIQEMESKMGARLTTQPIVDKLNRVHNGIDRLFFRHPTVFGLAGLAASLLLTYISGTLIFRR